MPSVEVANLTEEDTVASASPRARVIRWLSSAISTGELPTGTPIPSERVLSEHLSVSRETVRAAIRDLTDQGLIGDAGEGRLRRVTSDRTSATALEAETLLSNTVALLGAGQLTSQPPKNWDSSIQYAVSQLLERAGHHVLAVNPHAPDAADLTSLATMKPLGVLLTYNAAESESGQAVIAQCQKHRVPVVAYGDAAALATVDRVSSDHAAGAGQLTEYLIAQGRKRLLRLWRFPDEHQWLSDRNQGFESVVRQHALPLLPAVRTPQLSTHDVLGKEAFGHVARMLAGYLSEYVLSSEPIDGLMVATDIHALQAAAALRLLGKVPGRDVLIVGYDNSYADYSDFQVEPTPPAATVDKQNGRLAKELVSLLLDRAAGRLGPEPQCRMVKPKLIVTKNV